MRLSVVCVRSPPPTTRTLPLVSCTACEPGTYALSSISLCVACQLGKIAPENGSSSCELCEFPRTTLGEGSTHCDGCRTDHYLATTTNGNYDTEYVKCWSDPSGACCECPEGAKCPVRSTIRTIEVKPEFYREAWTSPQLLECSPGFACLGGVGNGSCETGFDGALCR